ncbi:MAG: VCBS repeat-containing protein [Verrucomicrobiota bacterium]
MGSFPPLLFLPITVLFLGFIGCDQGPPSPDLSAPEGPSSSEEKTDVPPAELPGRQMGLEFHQRLADELINVDPAEDQWDSEAFSEEATRIMNDLGKQFLNADKRPSAEDVQDVITADFVCTELRPGHRAPHFEEHEIRIHIGAHPSNEDWKHHNADGFQTAWTILVEPLAEAPKTMSKFKMSHVEATDAGVETRILFEMTARQQEAIFQASAVWQVAWSHTTPPRIRSIKVTDYQEVIDGDGRLLFQDRAPEILGATGSYPNQLAQSFDAWRSRSDRHLVADLLGAQGLAIGDVNGDLLEDLYVLQPGGLPNRLFLHQTDGTALDISHASGTDLLDFCRSALFLDLDNDGDQDLAVALAWTLVLFENKGQAQFEERQRIASDGQINSMAAADFDGDSLIDLYLCGRDASGTIKSEQGALGIPLPYYDANNGGPSSLWKNQGDFTLSNVTSVTGMNVNNRRFSLACAWEDFDNDGDQDLYVANDFGRNNLYRNNGPDDSGQVTFTDIAEAAGVVDIGPGMSAAWGDLNQDGWMDLYVGNMWSNAGNRITLQKQFLPGASPATRAQARRHARGNSVYLNRGDSTFEDATARSGANMARWAWSSNFIDMNNDGREDLIVANGMITAGDTGDL